MPVLTSPPLVGGAGKPVTGNVVLSVTAPFDWTDALGVVHHVTTTPQQGVVRGGQFYALESNDQLILPPTPVGIGMRIVLELSQQGAVRGEHKVSRVVRVPDVATVTWAGLEDVEPVIEGPNYIVPDWAAEVFAARDEAVAIAPSMVTTGSVVGDNLILTRQSGVTINAGPVIGPKGDPGPPLPLQVSIDTDGTPYANPAGTHRVVIDTDGSPIYVEGALLAKDVAGKLELSHTPTRVYSRDETVAVIDSRVAANIADPATKTGAALNAWGAARTPARTDFNVRDYGAKGDNSTDDLSAFNAAYQAAVAAGGGTIRIPAGKYVLSGEWNIYRPNSPRIDIVIAGDDQLTTWVLSSFYGAGKALVNLRSPDGTRCSPTTFKNIQFRSTYSGGDANPVMVEIDGWGESRFDGVKFGASNNTHWRASSIQNLRSRDVTSYYGGKNFVYRATDGALFAVSAATRTITADRDVFVAGDEGMAFFIIPSSDSLRIMYTLGTVVGPREVQIAADTRFQTHVLDAANAKGGFDAARASVTAGSTTLTANAACFSASDVGRVLVIRNGRQGPWGAALLRARIAAFTSPTQVVLDRAATLTATQTPFAQPVIDFWVDDLPGRSGSSSTDLKIRDLQVEAYAGLSLSVMDSLQFHMQEMKMHGEHDPIDARNSTGMAWLDDVAGTFSGEFDGASTSDVRMHFSNMNDTLHIPFLSTRRVWNEPLLQAEEMLQHGALVDVGTFVSYRHDDHGPTDFVIDKNVDAGRDPKIVFTGAVTMISGTDAVTAPRVYHGMGLWTDTAGRMVMTSPDGTEYRVSVTDAGSLSITPL